MTTHLRCSSSYTVHATLFNFKLAIYDLMHSPCPRMCLLRYVTSLPVHLGFAWPVVQMPLEHQLQPFDHGCCCHGGRMTGLSDFDHLTDKVFIAVSPNTTGIAIHRGLMLADMQNKCSLGWAFHSFSCVSIAALESCAYIWHRRSAHRLNRSFPPVVRKTPFCIQKCVKVRPGVGQQLPAS